MGQRIFAALFLVGFFAALPAWFLSTQEGYVTIDCTRAGSATCNVHERFAFGSNDATYSPLQARAHTHRSTGRRGTTTTYQLVLVTAGGAENALRTETGNAELVRVARDLDVALAVQAQEFHASLSPDPFFWFAVGLVVLFGGAGLFIAVSTHASEGPVKR